MPADGWMKFSLTVVNYDSLHHKVSFKAICVETGKDLAFYPNLDQILLVSGVENKITVFMDEQCGWNERPEPGRYKRTIRFVFSDSKTSEELTFDQPYDIEIPQQKSETSSIRVNDSELASGGY